MGRVGAVALVVAAIAALVLPLYTTVVGDLAPEGARTISYSCRWVPLALVDDDDVSRDEEQFTTTCANRARGRVVVAAVLLLGAGLLVWRSRGSAPHGASRSRSAG